MTNKARTKTCHCGNTILEKPRDSEDQWEARTYCSRDCRTIEKPVERICYLYSIGFSTLQLSDLFGLGATTIKNLLKNNNVKTRKPFKEGLQVSEVVKPFVIAKYKELGSAVKAGEFYGLKYSQSRLVLLEAGVLKTKVHRKLIPKKVREGVIADALENSVTKSLVDWR